MKAPCYTYLDMGDHVRGLMAGGRASADVWTTDAQAGRAADGRVEMASGPRPEPSEPIKRLAASGLLPPDLASKFPKGQVAALAIISIEARGGGGICDLRIDEIATRSATGPSTVHSALKTAKQLGLLTVEVRHRLPNLIRIVSPDWLAWLEKGLRR